jgi:DNA-binding NarL/FixJ family response regulator
MPIQSTPKAPKIQVSKVRLTSLASPARRPAKGVALKRRTPREPCRKAAFVPPGPWTHLYLGEGFLTTRLRVLLADDHLLVADAIGRLLREEFDVAGRVADGRALVDAVSTLKPDVVVTDLTMPVLNGIDAIREIVRATPRARVVVVTQHADPRLAAEAMRAGAAGYVLKHSAGEELLQAVREVSAGRVFITPLIARDLIAALSEPAGAGTSPRLTPRQRQVLQLVAEGRTMKQVAALLKVSRRTAESHKYQMMELLGAHSTAELVQHAIRMGLVTMESPRSTDV